MGPAAPAARLPGGRGAIAVVFAVSAIAFDGDVFEFLGEQSGQGAAGRIGRRHARGTCARWSTASAPDSRSRSGAAEIVSGPADFVAGLLKWATLAVLVGAARLVARTGARDPRRPRRTSPTPVVSRDFVFTLVLLLVIASRVLSPQYLIWLFGLAAVALTERRSRDRPAGLDRDRGRGSSPPPPTATRAPGGPHPSTARPFNMVFRNLALLVAAVDASSAMYLLLRRSADSAGLATAGDRAGAAAAPATAPP